jgi:hypothetical protein
VVSDCDDGLSLTGPPSSSASIVSGEKRDMDIGLAERLGDVRDAPDTPTAWKRAPRSMM